MTPFPKRVVFTKPENLQVCSWSPGEDGEGVPCTQVHVLFDLKVLAPDPVVMRLHSARITDELISALIKHRLDVWPESEIGETLRQQVQAIGRLT